MSPWVVNIALVAVLVWLLFDRRRARWPKIAAQGLGFDDGTSVIGAFRATVAGNPEPWVQGTLTRDPAGDYLWTQGGSPTPQRIGHLRVESARVSGWWEGIWSLQSDWVVLHCSGSAVTGGEPFDVATSRAALRSLPDLLRYADTR